MAYGGVERSDNRKEAEPKPRKDRRRVPTAGEDAIAPQESNFSGKRTYDSGRREQDANKREKR